MERKYTSLEQIDEDLKILHLRKEIDLVCLKSDYQSLIRNFSIKRIFSGAISDAKEQIISSRKSFLALGFSYLYRRFIKK